MTDIVNTPIGKFGNVDLSFTAGVLQLSVGAHISVDDLLTIIENAIPGSLDNKLIDGLKAIIDKVDGAAATA